MLTITGYSDRISVRPGETVKFMVNCEHPTYQADIVRLICADNTPAGPGFKERLVRTPVSKRHKGRRQAIHAGSYALVESRPLLETLGSFTVQAMIWPTTPGKGEQGIVTKWDPRRKTGFALVIDADGSVALRLGMADGTVETVSAGKPLLERHWYLAAASYDADSGRVTVHQEPLLPYARVNDGGTAKRTLGPVAANTGAPIVMAGIFKRRLKGRMLVDALYNGKIDSPRLVGRALDRLEIERMRNEAVPAGLAPDVLCAWDFSRDITSIKISDRSPHHFHGKIVNLPARGMTGWNFSGEEMCWRHARHEYGAIHFHDDDLYDAGWEVDFEWQVPARMASGVYAARLRAKGGEDYVPFVVLPAPGRAARIAFLLPTVEYMAYANEHMAFDGALGELLTGQLPTLNANQLFLNEHREYGASLYDTHSDGSGVCYSSRLRPILNMRPKVETPWACAGDDSTNAREFILDMYVVDWLTHFGFEHDVITDEDVHREGIDLLKPYNVLITGGHPEYYSKAMRDAVHGFTQQGGRLMYLGGNGFYWRVAMHKEVPGVIEVRRCEAAIRTWEADPGEYYHSFTGEYGGLWRHQGDTAPQRLAGVGFVAEGFDKSSYYRRMPGSFDPRARFIFEGIDGDELIGDFGYHGEGAAGNELDATDSRLGTPPHALVLARSENHTDLYLVVNEEVLVNHSGLGGTEHEKVKSDMVFYETPNGGAVFSVGSICYPASLPWNGYDNNIATLTTNVLRRFADPEPF